MGRTIFLIALIATAAFLGGCASTEDDSSRVSTIPWNRPESWESQGPFGGMMNPESNY